MKETALFVGWGGTFPGREHSGLETYREWTEILEGLKATGEIEDFMTVLLSPHGGELNGFTLVFADTPKLFELMASEDGERLRRRAIHEHATFMVVATIAGKLVEREYKLLEEEVLPALERTPVGA